MTPATSSPSLCPAPRVRNAHVCARARVRQAASSVHVWCVCVDVSVCEEGEESKTCGRHARPSYAVMVSLERMKG
jgi:hypothetical protein